MCVSVPVHVCLCACAGDNMLTAVCVARECGMVQSGDDLAQVQATVDSSGCPRVVYRSVGEGPPDLECSIECHTTGNAKVELQAVCCG